MLVQFRKLLHAISTSSGRRALRAGVAASIEHRCALDGTEYKTVVDIGANVGQFALFAREQYPCAMIYSFEPLDDCWKKFNEIFAQDSRIQLFRCGIGPSDTNASLNVTNRNDSSSLLAPAEAQRHVFGTTVNTNRTVELRKLASVLRRDQLVSPAFLKLDVQGFELQALRGCEELLSSFEAIYVEASYVELYEGQALVGDIIDFLRLHGFAISGVFNQHVDSARGPLQADFLFKQKQRS